MTRDEIKAEVVKYLLQGKTRHWIAGKLHISPRTVTEMRREEQARVPRSLRYPWLPADDDSNRPGGADGYMPTPDEIEHQCRLLRANRWFPSEGETEEFRA